MTDFEIASPGDFAVEPETVQLPSQRGTNKAVLLKRPDLIDLMTGDGEIPDILSGMVMSALDNAGPQEFHMTRENLPDIMQSMNVICKAAFVQPVVWDAPADETHIALSDLSFNDKAFVFSWALGAEYESAKSFRDESPAGVEPVPFNNGLRDTPKRKVRARP